MLHVHVLWCNICACGFRIDRSRALEVCSGMRSQLLQCTVPQYLTLFNRNKSTMLLNISIEFVPTALWDCTGTLLFEYCTRNCSDISCTSRIDDYHTHPHPKPSSMPTSPRSQVSSCTWYTAINFTCTCSCTVSDEIMLNVEYLYTLYVRTHVLLFYIKRMYLYTHNNNTHQKECWSIFLKYSYMY